jgi:hypothetical protein
MTVPEEPRTEQSDFQNEWEANEDEIHPAVIVIGRMVFGPMMLTRPCDPAGNCIGWRIALPALVGSVGYALIFAAASLWMGIL